MCKFFKKDKNPLLTDTKKKAANPDGFAAPLYCLILFFSLPPVETQVPYCTEFERIVAPKELCRDFNLLLLFED
jgi:hypothetical protein